MSGQSFADLLEIYKTTSVNLAAYLAAQDHHVEVVPGIGNQASFLFTRNSRLDRDIAEYETGRSIAKSLLKMRTVLVRQAWEVVGGGGRHA